ncbi:glycosyltransferase [Candidatus Bathyarchaeota archaeon]|nr:glycosyltransferase [Candidatus Bathyarchaeota archaeon]
MRVLAFTPSYPRYRGDYHGGFVRDLCTRLSRHVDLSVLAPRSRTMGDTSDGYPVTRFPYLPWRGAELVAESTMVDAPASHLVQLPMYLASAYLHRVKDRFDVVHTHLAIPLGFLSVHSPRGTPNVITCHGSDCMLPLVNPGIRPFARDALRRADRVVAVSDHVMRMAVSLGADAEKTETLYLGVDTGRFKPTQRRSREKLTVGTLGRLVSQKNVEDILHATAAIESKVDVKIIVGGDGPQMSRLKELAGSLGLQDIEFMGRVHDPVGFYRRCDVFVLASTSEGLSVSLQEAMSTGCVPVAVDGYGCGELVEHGVNGLLFKPRDAQGLAQKILEAAERPGLGAEARRIIMSRFDADKNYRRYLEIYRELAG